MRIKQFIVAFSDAHLGKTYGLLDARQAWCSLQVLQDCELLPDLQCMPQGDGTHVTAAGDNLSGGQQARLSLARTLYTPADTYLLDDAFAALNAEVATAVLTNVLMGPLLEGATVVIAGNFAPAVAAADFVVTMTDGHIASLQSQSPGPTRGLARARHNTSAVRATSLASDMNNSFAMSPAKATTSATSQQNSPTYSTAAASTLQSRMSVTSIVSDDLLPLSQLHMSGTDMLDPAAGLSGHLAPAASASGTGWRFAAAGNASALPQRSMRTNAAPAPTTSELRAGDFSSTQPTEAAHAQSADMLDAAALLSGHDDPAAPASSSGWHFAAAGNTIRLQPSMQLQQTLANTLSEPLAGSQGSGTPLISTHARSVFMPACDGEPPAVDANLYHATGHAHSTDSNGASRPGKVLQLINSFNNAATGQTQPVRRPAPPEQAAGTPAAEPQGESLREQAQSACSSSSGDLPVSIAAGTSAAASVALSLRTGHARARSGGTAVTSPTRSWLAGHASPAGGLDADMQGVDVTASAEFRSVGVVKGKVYRCVLTLVQQPCVT